MAFSLCEKDNIQWVTSDVLGTKHLFSRRLGDVGDFPFSSKPDPEWESESRQERVRALWQRFRTAAEFPAEGFCFTRQVHGTVLRYVTEAERAMPPLPHPPEDCDGLITDRKDVPLCVWTADCVPVLFRDPKAGIVAAAHSGWKGTVADMMGSVVRRMEDMGARAENIRAAIGPAISRCCFETGPEVPEAVRALLGSDAEGLCRRKRASRENSSSISRKRTAGDFCSSALRRSTSMCRRTARCACRTCTGRIAPRRAAAARWRRLSCFEVSHYEIQKDLCSAARRGDALLACRVRRDRRRAGGNARSRAGRERRDRLRPDAHLRRRRGRRVLPLARLRGEPQPRQDAEHAQSARGLPRVRPAFRGR